MLPGAPPMDDGVRDSDHDDRERWNLPEGFEALKQGDFGAVEALLDENVKWHRGDPGSEAACHNRTEALDSCVVRSGVDQESWWR